MKMTFKGSEAQNIQVTSMRRKLKICAVHIFIFRKEYVQNADYYLYSSTMHKARLYIGPVFLEGSVWPLGQTG